MSLSCELTRSGQEPCNTFCLIGYNKISFLAGTYDFKTCNPIGCAKVNENGDWVNDAASRLGVALSGDLVVYKCDNSTFRTNPDGLQVTAASGLPCNYYNPGSESGAPIDQALQVCTKLEVLGDGYRKPNWALEHIPAVVGIVIAVIAVLILGCLSLCVRKQRLQRKKRCQELKENDEGDETDLKWHKEVGVLCSSSIKLQPGVTGLNFVTAMFSSSTTICLLVFLNAFQPFLLTNVYGVDTKELGKITGTLQLADEMWSIILVGVWGILSDRLGRRFVVIAGYLHCAVACVLLPHGQSVYPGLLLIRLVYAQGGAALATMMTALLADYVDRDYLGRAIGILGFMSGLGALLAVFVFAGAVPAKVCVTNAYYVVAGFAACMMCVTFVGLQSRSTHLKHLNETDEGDDQPIVHNAFRLLKEGITIAWRNSTIALAYASGFLARGGTAIISSFISLWINKYFIDNKLCDLAASSKALSESSCGDLTSPDKVSCPAAFTQSSRVVGTAQTMALLGALLFGFLCNKSDPLLFFSVSAACAGVFYLTVIFLTDPRSMEMYGFSILWGLGEIAVVISSQFLLTKNMPPKLRGTMAGCYSVVGGIGIAFIGFVGGILFDAWFSGAPFVLTSILTLCTSVVGFVLWWYKARSGHQVVEAEVL